MTNSDVIKYTMTLRGCNGGRSIESGTIVVTTGSLRNAAGAVTRQPQITVTTGARVSKNIWVHLINFRAQAVPGTGRTMIWLVPGPDCNIEDVNAAGQCTTTPVCRAGVVPNYAMSVSSVGGVTTNGTFQPASSMRPPQGSPPATYDPNLSTAALNKVVKQLSATMSGTFPVDLTADVIPLGRCVTLGLICCLEACAL